MDNYHTARYWVIVVRHLTKKNVGPSNLFFHGPVILPYILNSIWQMNVIFLENTAFDLKINLGHSDLCFTVQW